VSARRRVLRVQPRVRLQGDRVLVWITEDVWVFLTHAEAMQLADELTRVAEPLAPARVEVVA
jgi:hypothetical protein